MAVSSDPSRVGSDVEVSGRSPTDTNADINGYYTWQSDLWNGRATYKQKRPVGQPKYMYYISARQVWAIGEYAGSLAPIAYVTVGLYIQSSVYFLVCTLILLLWRSARI